MPLEAIDAYLESLVIDVGLIQDDQLSYFSKVMEKLRRKSRARYDRLTKIAVLHDHVSSLWKLPIVFVCEHNHFCEFTRAEQVTSGQISDRARAFGIHAQVVDGNDVEAVWKAAAEAVSGSGPTGSARNPVGRPGTTPARGRNTVARRRA